MEVKLFSSLQESRDAYVNSTPARFFCLLKENAKTLVSLMHFAALENAKTSRGAHASHAD